MLTPHYVQDKIDVQLKARTGVEDILELYSKKPELGNDQAIEESRQQLDMIAAELEKLHTELHTYQASHTLGGCIFCFVIGEYFVRNGTDYPTKN